MQIKKDFTIQPVGGMFVAVPVGATSKSFHGMVQLNETGAVLWKRMAEKDCTEAELTEALLSEYDVERETAATAVRRVVEQLRAAEILQ